jgi:tetratricopeptide (TPR) repeat protein
MSLVNDMLNDLETRRSQHKPAEPRLDWLTASHRREKIPAWPRWALLLTVVACFVIVAVTYQPWLMLDNKQIVESSVQDVGQPVIENAPATISDLEQAAKPLPATQPALKPPQRAEMAENGEPVKELLEVVTGQEVAQQLATVVETAEPAAKPTADIKTVPVLTAEQLSQKTITDAGALIKRRKFGQAEKVLAEQLKANPGALQESLMLSSLWVELGRLIEAESLVDRLLIGNPYNSDLLLLKARVYLQQGKSQQALQLLQTQQPSLQSQPAYYEYQAVAAQQAKQFQLAEDVYKQLLTVDARRSDWWFGLAVAFDAQAKQQQALSAYQHSLQLGGLRKNLQAYAQQRVAGAYKG